MSRSQTNILTDILSITRKYHGDFEHQFPPKGPITPVALPFDISMAPLYLAASTARFTSKVYRSSLKPGLQKVILERIPDLADVYQQTFAKSCRRLLASGASGESCKEIIETLRHTLEARFEDIGLSNLLSEAERSQAACFEALQQLRPSQVAPTERRPFNAMFTPYLEAYFEQNAYPSAADQESLAKKGNMDRVKITNWFQNHRNRLRSADRESEIKRLPPSRAVNIDLIENRIAASTPKDVHHDNMPDAADCARTSAPDTHLDLDELARSSTTLITKTYETRTVEPCPSTTEAFKLHTPSQCRPSAASRPAIEVAELAETFGDVNVRASNPQQTTGSSKSTVMSSRGSTLKMTSKMSPLKATLRSCFSAAITLTCPGSHPALVPQKNRTLIPLSTVKSTILEQERIPVQPYNLPVVLPTWELSAPEPLIRRKKPSIASHAGKTRPGSPYPQQTISRMSSTSSLTSMASNDSQSSSCSTSSDFSVSTAESSELDTPAQSPSPYNVDLIDDVRFSDDMFGDYLFYSNPMPDNFFFDISVEEPFDKDVSLSVEEFDKSVSMSIAEFEATTLPTFEFFES